MPLLNTCRKSARVQGNAKRRRAQTYRLDAASTGKHENMRAGSKDGDAVEIILTEKARHLKQKRKQNKTEKKNANNILLTALKQ